MIDTMTTVASMVSPNDGPERTTKSSDPGKQVEKLFARMMIKEMRKAMPKEGPFGGKEMSMFMDLLDDVLAERMADSGNMGLAEQMNQAINPSDGSHLRSSSERMSLRPSHEIPHSVHHHHPSGVAQHLAVEETLPVSGRISSRFGKRVHPITGKTSLHQGLDIAAPEGTPIEAARPGTVTFAGEKGGYGLVVYIDHGDGLETRYAHCSALNVKTGQKIPQGHIVGEVGSTGRSTGSHLHFEARKNGKAINPETLFQPKEEKSSKTNPLLVRQEQREVLQVSNPTRGTP